MKCVDVFRFATGLLSLLPASALAAGNCGPGICDAAFVKKLYVVTDGTTYIQTDKVQTSLNCTQAGGVYITLLPSAQSQQIFALLLTAHMQQTPVAIRINESSAGCTIAYVTSDK